MRILGLVCIQGQHKKENQNALFKILLFRIYLRFYPLNAHCIRYLLKKKIALVSVQFAKYAFKLTAWDCILIVLLSSLWLMNTSHLKSVAMKLIKCWGDAKLSPQERLIISTFRMSAGINVRKIEQEFLRTWSSSANEWKDAFSYISLQDFCQIFFKIVQSKAFGDCWNTSFYCSRCGALKKSKGLPLNLSSRNRKNRPCFTYRTAQPFPEEMGEEDEDVKQTSEVVRC